MTFLAWYSLVVIFLSTLGHVILIGQPRKTITPMLAVGEILMSLPVIIFISLYLFAC